MTHPSDHDSSLDDAPDAELRALIARARSLPPLRPSRDLWPDIAARLEQPASAAHPTPAVTPPAGGRVLTFLPPRARGAGLARRTWLAAAAVVLAAVSSGATYLVMRRPTAAEFTTAPAVVVSDTAGQLLKTAQLRAPSVAVAATAPRDRASLGSMPTGGTSLDPTPPGAPLYNTPDTVSAVASARTPGHALPGHAILQAERADLNTSSPLHAVARGGDAAVPGAAEYDREIADLRAVVAGRRGDLDSATVVVLARNLAIIDTAIAESRAALARDPHSPFLGEQLTRALGQKVELLRTAALLPRT